MPLPTFPKTARAAALTAFVALAACAPQTAPAPAVAGIATAVPERAIRRDIPITNAIRRAYAAGTRDSTGRPGRNYWQNWMEYRIDARLDVPTNTIAGRETIVLHNNSGDTLKAVWMRLDQNIFTARAARNNTLSGTIQVTEGMRITRLALNGQPVTLVTGNQPAAPPTMPAAYQLESTVARITVPAGIAPKGAATLEVEWNFEVPAVERGRGIRMGRLADTLYQVAQWYPRIAVYDDLRGRNDEPYLGSSEFFNEFGRFEVSIDVPAGWLVGATGVLQNPNEVLSATTRDRLSHVLESDETRTIVGPNEFGAGKATATGDRLVWRFVADTVNDFAWATSKAYVWEATRATIPGKGPIPIHILHQAGSTRQFPAEYPGVLRHALEFYSKMWVPYAFPQLTATDGPELGMEYPMFIMSGIGAGDHEAGHEWHPMMVSNNETWYGWMDEGFNMYQNILSDADYAHQPPRLDGQGASYGGMSGNESEPPMMWNANHGGPVYGFTTYNKAPMMLSMLGGIVGDSAVQRAQSEFLTTWKFKHPSPWDYMFSFNRSLHQDLGWFWYYWLFTTDAVNGSIQGVTTTGTKTVVTVRQDGQMPSPVVLQVRFAADGPAITTMPGSRMVDARTAVVTYPVDVWFTGNRTFDATLDFGGRTIERITLDPYRRFPDRDARDNTWPR